MTHYLNSLRTIASWETEGGDHAFARYRFVVTKAEMPGYSGQVAHRELAELVHVAAEDADLAHFLVEAVQPDDIGRLFAERGIAVRPTGEPAAATVVCPARWQGPSREAA